MLLLSTSLLNEPVSANCLIGNIMNANIVVSEITCASRRETDIKSVRVFKAYMTNQTLIWLVLTCFKYSLFTKQWSMSLSNGSLERLHYFKDLKFLEEIIASAKPNVKSCVSHSSSGLWLTMHLTDSSATQNSVWEVRELTPSAWKVVSICYLVYYHG